MSTNEESEFLAEHYEVVRVEVVPCVTEQFNFPFHSNRPWARADGTCSICGQSVGFTQLAPDDPCRFTRIAQPHTRTRRWFSVSDDEFAGLLSSESWERGSGDWMGDWRRNEREAVRP